MNRRSFSGILLLALCGCGGSGRSQADIDHGKAVLTTALDNWENPSAADKEPIPFNDELRKSHALLDYMIGDVNAQDPKFLLFTVTLKLKDRKGKTSEREVVYSVELSTPPRVVHDPYY